MVESLNRDDQVNDWSDVSGGEAIGLVPPGDVLRHEFMEPLGLSASALARDLKVSTNRVTRILRGNIGITAQTAIMLSHRFGTSAEFWMNLQTAHDLEVMRAEMAHAA